MPLLVPGTKWDPLGKQTESPMSAHDVLCFHTMVGTMAGTSAMFHENGYGGTESHLGVGGDGYTEQWQDCWYQADANLDGNPYVISIETADKGENFGPWVGGNAPPWTDKQLTKLIAIGTRICHKDFHANCPSSWLCHSRGIPASLIPDTRPGRRGIGYHRQGIDGSYPDGRVTGGVRWSKATGKTCPTDIRIGQLKTIVIPGIARALGGEDLDAAEHKALMDTNHRSAEMYKALRGDQDADQALVTGIRNHFRAVLDEEAAQKGSALRVAIGDITLDRAKRALVEHPVAQAEVVPE